MRFGYHVRVEKAPVSAIRSGVEAACETIQMFPGSPQQWGTPPVTGEEIAEFRSARAESGIDPVVFHSIYLINMAAPDESIFKRSVSSLASELKKADLLGISAVVTHIGNHRGEGDEFGVARIASGVSGVFEKADGDALLLLETTAGAGTSIGHTFKQFGQVFDIADRPDRLGFCLDTCHIFAAGYDLSKPDGLDSALDELDRFIGLDRLKLLHLNDSRGACGSHVDRHEHIGRGQIGLDAFRNIVNHDALKDLPAIIELPREEAEAPDDIGLLRSLVT